MAEIDYDFLDEEPNCINCIHVTDSNFDCAKRCGAKHGWGGYQAE